MASPTSNSKRPRSDKITIGTHNGVFHCDEIIACFMLRQLSAYSDAEIVRTRDPEILKKCDIVVDVGAVFDKSTHKYDHHQREFIETLSSLKPEYGDHWKIKLSSAGLIYTYFGEDVIKSILKKRHELTLSDDAIKKVYIKVYENFIQEIDAIDNGVPMFDSEPAYRIMTNLSSRVGNFNPQWNASVDIEVDTLFNKALAYAGEELIDKISYFSTIWWPARTLVKESIDKRTSIHPSGEIAEFVEIFPWKEHLFDLEKELNLEGQLKFVIYKDSSNSWRVQGVPVAPGSFISRKGLHKDWWGVRDADLSGISGIPDSVFCHATGFIGGNKTREGALLMAIKSLEA